MIPFAVMALLYLALAGLVALDASLIHFELFAGFSGLRWLRVHLITLGTLSEALFGVLPLLLAIRAGRPRPRTRWDIWLSLNAGLLTLLVGIPLVNRPLIVAGGTLVFVAALLLIGQVLGLRADRARPPAGGPSLRFYVAGLGYLLLGVVVGTGLWLGWSAPLRIGVPIEVHIHANNWGFLSLLFAGLLIDIHPRVTDRSLAWPGSIPTIFWAMTLGALGLVLGPWLRSNLVAVPGLILHLGATIGLLLNVVRPLVGDRSAWTVGMVHLVSAYAWILAPVLVAPLIIAGVPGFPGAGIEQNAPQALIYGWVLQFGYAVLPFLFARALLPDEPARLGGHAFSLVSVHLGCVLLWIGIFATGAQATLHGLAYALWALSALPIAVQLGRIVTRGLDRLEAPAATSPAASPPPR